MDNLLQEISVLIENNYLIAPILALIAGIITSFMPCNLSSVPLIISVVSANKNNETKKALKLSIIFSIGLSITFTILGIIAALSSSLLGSNPRVLYIIVGIIMILMSFQIWELFDVVPATYLTSKNRFKGTIGALVAGILSGIFASPCSTPVLVALLAIVSSSSNLLLGIVLLLCYSLGHSVITIIAGTSIGFVNKIMKSEKYGKYSKMIRIVLGIIMVLIGLYLIYMAI